MQQQQVNNAFGDIPNPWIYFDISVEDFKPLFEKMANKYLKDPFALTNAIMQALDDTRCNETYEVQGAIWFIVADFIGLNYERYHPEYKMKPVPAAVLKCLRYPYNQMSQLGYEDQKAFKHNLPIEYQRMVYLDD